MDTVDLIILLLIFLFVVRLLTWAYEDTKKKKYKTLGFQLAVIIIIFSGVIYYNYLNSPWNYVERVTGVDLPSDGKNFSYFEENYLIDGKFIAYILIPKSQIQTFIKKYSFNNASVYSGMSELEEISGLQSKIKLPKNYSDLVGTSDYKGNTSFDCLLDPKTGDMWIIIHYE